MFCLYACIISFWLGEIFCQNAGGRYYGRDGVYIPPGDPDYRTYTYNSRRYGQSQPSDQNPSYPYDRNYNRGYGDRRYGGFDDKYQPNLPPTPIPLPGILAGWRTDLQGKQRADWQNLLPDRDIIVTTGYGQIQGFRVYVYDNPDPFLGFRPGIAPVERIQGNISVFLGIPYAEPLTKEGRFKPPRVHKGWQLIQAVDFGPACPQPFLYTGLTKGIRDVDEDCLYLNIYSPSIISGRAQLFPVMFYIHGGDFIHGASNLFPGHMMAAFYEVVVVTINYRLGALGFLSTGDSNSPGNYGILDQAMALRWVYDNIHNFNGDKNLITVFGPDAGAASAGLLMVAPKTRNMISRVIAQSGSALADWALITDMYRAQNTSKVFAQRMGCNIESSFKLVNCLKQGRSWADLSNAEFPPEIGTYPWAPVLDGNFSIPKDDWYEGWQESDWKFLSETPEVLIRKRKFNPGLVYMSSVTTQEAAPLIANNISLAPYFIVDEKFFQQKVEEMVLRYNYTLNPKGIYHAIRFMYTYGPDPNNTDWLRTKYIEMMSDFLYTSPNDKMVKLLTDNHVPVYMYVQNTTVEALRSPEWNKVPHDIELYFLSGAPFMDIEFLPKKWHLERDSWTGNDRNMSHFFMKAYSNFAKYGHPSQTQILGLNFDMIRKGELKYLNINTTYNSSILLNYRQTECLFWTTYLPSVIGMLAPIYRTTTEFWWEPTEPLQIAFWSMSATCLLLIVAVFICCILWRNAKRQSDRYFNRDLIAMAEQDDHRDGIENQSATGYEYRDSPAPVIKNKHQVDRGSLPSSRTTSANSLRDVVLMEPKKLTPISTRKVQNKIKTLHGSDGVPHTQV